jgi:diguanylate cyclase (GGDEF)-like protein/PAS domain S-box-containing protein
MEELRSQVESQMHGKVELSLEVVREMAPPEIQLLFHELRVHQIELEMQNEELRHAKDALDSSRARYKELYDLAPVGYCTVSEAGIILRANLTLATLLGVPRTTLARQPPFTRFVLSTDQDDWYRLRARLLESGTAQRGELRLRLGHTSFAGGEEASAWVEVAGSVVRGESGERVLHLAISDIGVRKKQEAQLLASEERYRTLAQDMPVFVSARLPDGTLTYVNESLAALVGRQAHELIGHNFAEFLSEKDRSRVTTLLAALTPAQPVETHEQSFWGADGQEHTHQWTNRAFFDGAGTLIRLQAVGQDITERKQLEHSLLRVNQSLRESQVIAGLGTYVHHFSSGTWESSEVLDDLFGIDPSYVRSTAGWLALVHPDDRAMMESYLGNQVVASGTPFDREYRIVRHRDKAERWVHGLGQLEFDEQEGVLRLRGTIQDITARKQSEAKLLLAASVFGYAREGITITSAGGTIIDVNDAFTRITGYSREEVIGKNPHMLSSGRHDKAFYETMWRGLTEQGHWSGEIWNRRKSGEVYPELMTISAVRDEQGHTQQYVALFSDITAIKQHQSQLEHLAHFDALTHLPNRLLLADRLQQAMAQAQRRGQQVAVAYLDLDGFKNVNDRHGHDVGDLLLVALATAMKDTLREGDTLARIGGDEFVAVLIDLDGIESCVPMLTRLLEAAAAPVSVGALVLQGSASIGVTFYPQDQDMESDQLLRQADQAMYQAKLAGKNRYHVFDAVQDSSMRVHHESLERIRLALAQQEFVLYYQPKVNMHSGEVVGAEALIRWQHPDKGLLAPIAFLPVIEDHPLAVNLGEWVIDTALTQIERWRAVGLDLPVSVNIGARQLQQANFVERLQVLLARHPQVHPACLELEVLETSALADMAQVSQVIEDCAGIGVTFALDDFGTGYSSLTYLKRLRVALLKIDQSFVCDMLDDPDDMAILEGVIGLAAAFKREVIAEGVETVAHGTALLQLGCTLAQGYGIARPMPPEQFPAWAATWKPDAAWCGLG